MSYTELEAGYQGLRRAPAGFYIGEDAAAAIIRSSSSGLGAVIKVGRRLAAGRPALGRWGDSGDAGAGRWSVSPAVLPCLRRRYGPVWDCLGKGGRGGTAECWSLTETLW